MSHPQHFADGLPSSFRKPVRCRADELDLLCEAARAAGFGIEEIKTVRRQFKVTFIPVAYQPTSNQETTT